MYKPVNRIAVCCLRAMRPREGSIGATLESRAASISGVKSSGKTHPRTQALIDISQRSQTVSRSLHAATDPATQVSQD